MTLEGANDITVDLAYFNTKRGNKLSVVSPRIKQVSLR